MNQSVQYLGIPATLHFLSNSAEAESSENYHMGSSEERWEYINYTGGGMCDLVRRCRTFPPPSPLLAVQIAAIRHAS